MAEFLTTQGISYQMENIVKGAKRKLVLVSPYLQLSTNFFARLKDASQKGITIKIIYRTNRLKAYEHYMLSTLNNLELFASQNLHAKCYFNETQMVITSMNMYEFSEKNNREIGILIDKSTDTLLFQKAVEEIASIVASCHKTVASPSKQLNLYSVCDTPGRDQKEKKRGHCIRCQQEIPFGLDMPFCHKCFRVWISFGDPYYEEQACHRCGEHSKTSMAKPQCGKCFVDGEFQDFIEEVEQWEDPDE